MTVTLPVQVQKALTALENAGFEAYIVGGCVRDSLRGVTPHDWDITTSATPDEMRRVFADENLLDIGSAHGTMTLLIDGMPLEITTYRTEGAYSDGRHPDFVRFSRRLEDDLSRRDFTVNAMAYHHLHGFIDPFGGRADLKNGILRCVGVAEERFEEDALRVMRALRFAATLPLSIEERTAAALLEKASGLLRISAERIEQELTKLLCGVKASVLLRNFSSVIFTVLPELAPMHGFDQHNRHHNLDVWEHTLLALENSPADPTIRWALLLHDAGKPETFTVDELGEGHFYGHSAQSASIAEAITARLRFSGKRQEQVIALVRHHDIPISPTRKAVRRALSRFGRETLELLVQVKAADRSACHPLYREDAAEQLSSVLALADEIEAENDCVSLSSLAVNGRDLMEAGFAAGPSLGALLQRLLDAVMDDACINEKEALLIYAAHLFNA